MSVLNRGLTAVADALFAPLTWLPPLVGLALAAAATAVVAVLVVRLTSNSGRIRAAKNGMYAALLEMRLFSDDIAAVLRAQLDVLRFNGRYLGASLVPILWLIVPFGLLVAQLETFYAYRPLAPHTPALVTARLRGPEVPPPGGFTLEAPAGVRVLTPGAVFPSSREVVWTIVGETPGRYDVTIHAGTETITKSLEVSDRVGRCSPVRPAATFGDEMAYPSEAPLASDGLVDRVSVAYPTRELSLFGWQAPWYVPYGLFTILGGWVAARFLHVEI